MNHLQITITKFDGIMKKTILLFICILTYPHYSSGMEEFWTQGYQQAISGFWGNVESVSGPGSSIDQTKVVQRAISSIINEYRIQTILDVPCGDFNWMRLVELNNCVYVGADIIKPLIDRNNEKYACSNISFIHLDVTHDPLQRCDLIICRDLLVHLSTTDIFKALQNFKASGSKYLLTTTFLKMRSNTNAEIESGGWRPLNLKNAPFNFPNPDLIINEGCTEQNGTYNDKSLGLWRLETLRLD